MDRKKMWLTVLVGLGIALWPVASASAHVTITPSTTAPGASAVLEVSFAHGCDGAATTALTIQLPAELRSVSARSTPGWDVETDSTSITYLADDPVPDGQRAAVELAVVLPERDGMTLAFPTVQTCTAGEAAWIEVPPAGQNADALELPAPTFTVGDPGSADEDHLDVGPAAQASSDRDGARGPAFAVLAVGVLGVGLAAAVLLRRRRR